MPSTRSLLTWRRSIMFLARGDCDLIGAGWVSCLARGNASGLKLAMAEAVLR